MSSLGPLKEDNNVVIAKQTFRLSCNPSAFTNWQKPQIQIPFMVDDFYFFSRFFVLFLLLKLQKNPIVTVIGLPDPSLPDVLWPEGTRTREGVEAWNPTKCPTISITERLTDEKSWISPLPISARNRHSSHDLWARLSPSLVQHQMPGFQGESK